MEGKSNFCSSLWEWGEKRTTSTPAFTPSWRNDETCVKHPRHAEDSGVEIQGFDRIFHPQHGLLHHEILQRDTIWAESCELYCNTRATQQGVKEPWSNCQRSRRGTSADELHATLWLSPNSNRGTFETWHRVVKMEFGPGAGSQGTFNSQMSARTRWAKTSGLFLLPYEKLWRNIFGIRLKTPKLSCGRLHTESRSCSWNLEALFIMRYKISIQCFLLSSVIA